LSRSLSTSFIALLLLGSLPLAARAGVNAQLHRVAPGESLASIASSAHISLGELARLNDIEGATLRLPAGTVLALSSDAADAHGASFSLPAGARGELPAAGTASEMPTADADLRMWSARAKRGAPVFAADPLDKSDTIHRFARGIISRTSLLAVSLTRNAMRYIGTPYVFGGTSPSGFDCSGYVQHVFGMLGIALPRTADAQFYAGHSTRGHMVAGDLVFFQTYLPGPSHVGIYLGTGRFIHSSSHGVHISRLRDRYWAARYLGAKRVTSRVAAR
jgi:cell wall-associated NlpC family hydrolase